MTDDLTKAQARAQDELIKFIKVSTDKLIDHHQTLEILIENGKMVNDAIAGITTALEGINKRLTTIESQIREIRKTPLQ